MSDTAAPPAPPAANLSRRRVFVPSPSRPPPRRVSGTMAWMQENLFSSPLNALITILGVVLSLWVIIQVVDWAFVRAIWGDVPADQCKIEGAGACWAFITEKIRFILFGLYPPDEQWRVLVAVGIILTLIIVSCFPSNWPTRTSLGVILATIGVATLLWGLSNGVPGREQFDLATPDPDPTFPPFLRGALIAIAIAYAWVAARMTELRTPFVGLAALGVFLVVYADGWEPYAPSYTTVDKQVITVAEGRRADQCLSLAEGLRREQPQADLSGQLAEADCTHLLRSFIGFAPLRYTPSQVDPDSIYGLHDALGLNLSVIDHALFFITHTIPDWIAQLFVFVGNLLVPLLNLLVQLYNWLLPLTALIAGPLALVTLALALVALPLLLTAKAATRSPRIAGGRLLVVPAGGIGLFLIFGFALGWLGAGSDIQDGVATLLGVALIAATLGIPFFILMLMNLRPQIPMLAYAWILGLVVAGILMWGGMFGLSPQRTTDFGGIALTIGLTLFGITGAFPIAVMAALGRRSSLPVVRWTSIIYIEAFRGVPLITLLIMSSVMLPLFLPDGVTINKLLRAQIAIMLFEGAYFAEAIRGGLQSINKGQYEAADSLGLNYARKTRLIILPQALSVSIPSMVNSLLSLFKDTTLVVVIGLYDLLLAAKTALTDREWLGFYLEAYVFLAVIYFILCFAMSRYSLYLEYRINTSKSR